MRQAGELRWRRAAIASVFFVNGAMLASWVSRIPAVQTKLHMSTGVLGLSLLGTAIGAMAGMPIAGRLSGRRGSRPVVIAGLLIMSAALPLAALAPNPALLAAALAVLGFGSGAVDVAMNTQAVSVESRYGRPIMPSFHGLWSAGSMSGALCGGAFAGRRIGVAAHLSAAAVVFGACGILVAATGMLSRREELPAPRDSDAPGEMQPVIAGVLAVLGLITFCSLLSEGAMGDWIAIYLHRTLRTTQQAAADGFAAMSLAMAGGRLLGDRVVARFGHVRVLRRCGATAAAGLLLAITSHSATLAIAGFALVGAGLSLMVPITFHAAGNLPGAPPGRSIAAVSTMGYTGFLIGPPLIGYAAEAIRLRNALGIVALLCATVAGLAGFARTRAGGERAVTP